jgi:hypothetical protein
MVLVAMFEFESYEDEKISADREDLVLQKYKERMA